MANNTNACNVYSHAIFKWMCVCVCICQYSHQYNIEINYHHQQTDEQSFIQGVSVISNFIALSSLYVIIQCYIECFVNLIPPFSNTHLLTLSLFIIGMTLV